MHPSCRAGLQCGSGSSDGDMLPCRVSAEQVPDPVDRQRRRLMSAVRRASPHHVLALVSSVAMGRAHCATRAAGGVPCVRDRRHGRQGFLREPLGSSLRSRSPGGCGHRVTLPAIATRQLLLRDHPPGRNQQRTGLSWTLLMGPGLARVPRAGTLSPRSRGCVPSECVLIANIHKSWVEHMVLQSFNVND